MSTRIITEGLGNGTLAGSISFMIRSGLSSAAQPINGFKVLVLDNIFIKSAVDDNLAIKISVDDNV